MADTTSTSAPFPPTMPGQAGFENGTQSHMPPPLNIPQNVGSLPQQMDTMKQMLENNVTSPTSAGGRRAAPEPNKRALYVGGLDPRVTEDVLKQIFETTGHVQSVKIIPDKNVSLACDTCSDCQLQPSVSESDIFACSSYR